MRNRVAKFLKMVSKELSDDPKKQRSFYRELKKHHAGSSPKEKRLAYTVMLKPELLNEIFPGSSRQ